MTVTVTSFLVGAFVGSMWMAGLTIAGTLVGEHTRDTLGRIFLFTPGIIMLVWIGSRIWGL